MNWLHVVGCSSQIGMELQYLLYFNVNDNEHKSEPKDKTVSLYV